MLTRDTSEWIGPYLWPSISPDQNPTDYGITSGASYKNEPTRQSVMLTSYEAEVMTYSHMDWMEQQQVLDETIP